LLFIVQHSIPAGHASSLPLCLRPSVTSCLGSVTSTSLAIASGTFAAFLDAHRDATGRLMDRRLRRNGRAIYSTMPSRSAR